MTTLDKTTPPQMSGLAKVWQRIPVLVQAIVTGFLVFAIVGNVMKLGILVLIPAPWSLVILIGVLWIYWMYFSGKWWQTPSAATRSEHFRATKLSVGTWKWSMITALLIVVAIQSSAVITFRLFEFPTDEWALGVDFKPYPIWLVWLYIILLAAVAGITEEVGFRGYMQVPLEKKYNPTAGIVIVSIMFVVLHFTQAWAPSALITLFMAGVMWGVLSHTSGSLIPAIISHTIVDIFNFSYWWTDVAGKFEYQPIAVTGIDLHFLVWSALFTLSGVLIVWALGKVKAVRLQS